MARPLLLLVDPEEIERVPLRVYLAAMSRARRANRALKAKYGETRVFSVLRNHFPTKGERTIAPDDPRASMIREQRNERLARRQRDHAAMLEAQGHLCYLCDDPFTADDPPTRDHVFPRALKGRDAGNILLAHASCNVRKADRRPTPRELARLREVNVLMDPLVRLPAA